MRRGTLLLLLAAVLVATPSVAQDMPKGYACTFPRGNSQAYVKGRFRQQP